MVIIHFCQCIFLFDDNTGVLSNLFTNNKMYVAIHILFSA